VRLEQVLLNLLVNALEAMPDGGRLALTVSLSPAQQPEWVELLVADTGPGIPDNLRERIFDPYFTTKREGTGMGLALCEKIIRQHDGTLDFQASEGGTVFRIRLPVIHDPKGESAKGTAWS
jgi:two-component system nitrogen regulation sensor histidine kinase GlnL